MSIETVKTGIVVADSTIRRAIVDCVGVGSSVVTSPFPPARQSARGRSGRRRLAARVTSSAVIRPPGPVPATSWSDTPSSTAVRRATGVAFGRRAPAPSPESDTAATDTGCALVDSCCDGSRSVVRSVQHLRRSRASRSALPTAAVPPSGTRIAASVPVGLRLVDDGRLVGLDLDQALASLERLSGRLQPAEDDCVRHRVRQLRHRQLAGHERLTP